MMDYPFNVSSILRQMLFFEQRRISIENVRMEDVLLLGKFTRNFALANIPILTLS